MVRHYKRKTQRGVTTAILEEAYNDIKVNGVKINTAATKYEIDRMTLTRLTNVDCCFFRYFSVSYCVWVNFITTSLGKLLTLKKLLNYVVPTSWC